MLPPRRTGDATDNSESPDGDDSPGLCRVDAGDPPVRAVGVGGVVADPRLPERRDDKPPRCRPLEGVKNGRDVLGEDLAPLGTGTPSCFDVEDVVKRLVELLEADGVGRLVPDESLHPPKMPRSRGWVRCDAWGTKNRIVMFFAPSKRPCSSFLWIEQLSKNKNSPLVKSPQELSQRIPLLHVGDEDCLEQLLKDITRDKTVLCRVEGDVFRIVPPFKKQGVDGRILDDNRLHEA